MILALSTEGEEHDGKKVVRPKRHRLEVVELTSDDDDEALARRLQDEDRSDEVHAAGCYLFSSRTFKQIPLLLNLYSLYS